MFLRPARTALVACLGLLLSSAAPDAAPLEPRERDVYRQAFAAIDKGDWAAAHRAARSADDPTMAKVMRWLEILRPGSQAGFEEVSRFYEESAGWPARGRLRARAEELMDSTRLTPRQVIAWFERHPPISLAGRLRQIDALLALGQAEKATAAIRAAWIEGSFARVEARRFYLAHKKRLSAEDHASRTDRLLWRGQIDAVRDMLPKLDRDQRALAEARLALRQMAGNVDALIARVPKSLRDDPGLIYERLRWRRSKGKHESARELLFDRPPIEPEHARLWWRERELQVRMSLAAGEIEDAYLLAASHSQTKGVGFAEAEWLAGWIALRFRHKPAEALPHFKSLYDGVATPISRSRAAYWAGRAAEELKRSEEAATWYARGAEHPTTFYGQLAAARLPDGGFTLPADPEPTPAEAKAFFKSEVVDAARKLAQLDRLDLARDFVMAASRASEAPGQQFLLAALARSLGMVDLGVRVARHAARSGVHLVQDGYPQVPVRIGASPEPALVHAVVRQESNFDERAVSPAGARGLMQLMPATAKRVSRDIRERYSLARLTNEPSYNLRLGRSYLEDMLKEFRGSYVMALAAYNAGPGRAKRWAREAGDPRSPDTDIVDWIERIPFSETRNYVQRVLEGVQVYRLRLGEAPARGMTQIEAINAWCLFTCGVRFGSQQAALPR